MAERYVNNGVTYVASHFSAGGTSLTVDDASKLPGLSAGDTFHVIVYSVTSPVDAEIMLVTGVSGNVLTVVPGYETLGGSATEYDHPAGHVVANNLTADSLARIVRGVGDSLYQPLGSSSASFVWGETPSGSDDDLNVTYNLIRPPVPPASLNLFLNGLLLSPPGDFTLSGNVVTMVRTPLSPDDSLRANYSY
jgi:hypothetical protein